MFWAYPHTEEIQHHVTKLAHNKSLGKSGVPAEELKLLPLEGIAYVHTLLQDFWEGRKSYKEWQTALTPSGVLALQKRSSKNTKYHGIVL
jgi:hypothetical protein